MEQSTDRMNLGRDDDVEATGGFPRGKWASKGLTFPRDPAFQLIHLLKFSYLKSSLLHAQHSLVELYSLGLFDFVLMEAYKYP